MGGLQGLVLQMCQSTEAGAWQLLLLLLLLLLPLLLILLLLLLPLLLLPLLLLLLLLLLSRKQLVWKLLSQERCSWRCGLSIHAAF